MAEDDFSIRTLDGEFPRLDLVRSAVTLRDVEQIRCVGVSLDGEFVLAGYAFSQEKPTDSVAEMFRTNRTNDDPVLHGVAKIPSATSDGWTNADITADPKLRLITLLEEKLADAAGKTAIFRFRQFLWDPASLTLSPTGVEKVIDGVFPSVESGIGSASAQYTADGKYVVFDVVNASLDLVGTLFRAKDYKPLYAGYTLLRAHEVVGTVTFFPRQVNPWTFALSKEGGDRRCKGGSKSGARHFFTLSTVLASVPQSGVTLQSIRPPALMSVWRVLRDRFELADQDELSQFGNIAVPYQNGGRPVSRTFPSSTQIAVFSRQSLIKGDVAIWTDQSQIQSLQPGRNTNVRVYNFAPWSGAEEEGSKKGKRTRSLGLLAELSTDFSVRGTLWHPSGDAIGFVSNAGGTTSVPQSYQRIEFYHLAPLREEEDECLRRRKRKVAAVPYELVRVTGRSLSIPSDSVQTRFNQDGSMLFSFGSNAVKRTDAPVDGLFNLGAYKTIRTNLVV